MYYIVSSGETSSGIMLSSNGSMFISSGGTANSTTINDYGNMFITYGGTANSTTINDYGNMFITYGGTASSTTINSRDYMLISSGETANSTTINSGCYMYISSGGTANNTTINFGGDMYIFSGGTADSTTINSGGSIYISSGGTANNTTINFGGSMYISSGGTATNIVENGGNVYIADGAYATFASNTIEGFVLSSHGGMTVHKNTIANSTTINDWSDMLIYSGGIANSTTINSNGYMYISSGGTANSTTIHSGGNMYIRSGGVANSTTINAWGYMHFSSGGTATNITANSNAKIGITVASNTYIQGTYNESAFEMKEAFISGYTIHSGGNMYITSGGTANSTTINSRGYMYISSGGTANSTTINSGGYIYIYSGGTANDTTINSDGTIYISSGGIHRGSLQLEAGAVVSAYSGATIDFTVADRTSADDYLINDLSLIKGTPTYTITISENQASGTYKLAQGASNFTGTISLGTTDTVYGSITVNGADFVYNGITYSLDQVNGNLTLTINTNTSVTLDGSGMTHAEAIAAGYELIVTTGGTYSSNIGHDGVEARIEGGTFNCTVSGGALTSSTNYRTWDVQENETNLTIIGGTFNKVLMGGDRVNYGNCEHVGDLNLTVKGGIFNSQIVGGMAYTGQSLKGQAMLTGNVNMTLAGGTFKSRIYGGSISTENYSTRTAIEGNVNILVDSSENELIFEDNVYIVVGSYQSGAIDGNVQVTFTGLGENLKMDADNLVWGGCSSDVYLINGDTRTFQSTISGSRTICFDDFTGEFNTGIRGFNVFKAANGSKLEILASNHLRDIERWELEWDTQLSGSFLNDFSGDTMNIDLTGWNQTATDLFDCAAGTFAGFDAMKKVTIGNETAVYSSELAGYASTNYKLVLNGTKLQLSSVLA